MNASKNNAPSAQANASSQAAAGQSPEDGLAAEPAVPRIATACPNCKATLNVRQAYVGSQVRCKHCNQIFLVQVPADTQPSAEVDDATSGSQTSHSSQDADPSNGQASGARDKALLHQLGIALAAQDELRTAQHKLKADFNELLAERDALAALLESVTGQLNTFRADLGAIASADVQSLASERDALRVLVHRLRDEKRDSDANQAEREDLISQLEKTVRELEPLRAERDSLAQRVRELEPLRAGQDSLARKLERFEGDLSALRAERDALAVKHGELSSELEAARAELARLTGRIEQAGTQSPSLADELDAARIDREELKWKLDEAEHRCRTMAETLGMLGVAVELQIQPQGKLQIKR